MFTLERCDKKKKNKKTCMHFVFEYFFNLQARAREHKHTHIILTCIYICMIYYCFVDIYPLVIVRIGKSLVFSVPSSYVQNQPRNNGLSSAV